MSVEWVDTNKHVYWAIYNEHYKQLKVFATCTDPEGGYLGTPFILTEWGFRWADEPFIRCEGRKVYKEQEFTYNYFIASVRKEDETS